MCIAKFLSAPGLAWQTAFKNIKVKLDLLTDIEKMLLIKKKANNNKKKMKIKTKSKLKQF